MIFNSIVYGNSINALHPTTNAVIGDINIKRLPALSLTSVMFDKKPTSLKKFFSEGSFISPRELISTASSCRVCGNSLMSCNT